jgi:ABC-type oligopeptide transport system substrate-binding subunit
VGLPSPLEFYELLYGPNYPGSFNRMGFQHASFDKNFELFKQNMNNYQSLIEMQKIVQEEVPLVPLVHASTLFVYHPWLLNYIPTELLFGVEQYFDIKR